MGVFQGLAAFATDFHPGLRSKSCESYEVSRENGKCGEQDVRTWTSGACSGQTERKAYARLEPTTTRLMSKASKVLSVAVVYIARRQTEREKMFKGWEGQNGSNAKSGEERKT